MAATIAVLREGLRDETVAATADTVRRAGHEGLLCLIGGRQLIIFSGEHGPELSG
jgi:hypothetical protein